MFFCRTMSYTLLSVFILGVVGCASATKTDSPSATADDAGLAGKQPAGEVRPDSTRESKPPSTSDQSKEAPRSSLDELQAGKSTATSASNPLRDVLFDYDRYDLTGEARDLLKAHADWLRNNDVTKLEVEGHCDERGTNEYNIALGAKRSQTAKDYLVRLGIAAERISTISYGKEIPACTESNENCWRQNRRARFAVVRSGPSS